MEIVKGKVEAINIKEPQEGQFGKWANYGIKVNGAWHNGKVTADKLSGKLIVKDKNYTEVTVGMEVEFVVDETIGKNDGKVYHNINQKMFTIKGSTQQQSAPAPQAPVASPQPLQSNKIEASAIDAHIWTECLKSAVATLDAMAKNAPVDKPVEISHERVMKLADIYFNKAIS